MPAPLRQELGFCVIVPILVHYNNYSAVPIANDSVTGSQTHVCLNIHYPCDMVEKGIINVSYCPTADLMVRDLTKKLSKQPFKNSRTCILIRLTGA